MILDVCCGSRMFYFNKDNEDVIFGDIRVYSGELYDGRKLEISPDVCFDFRSLPFKDSIFTHVIFDPPHLNKLGNNSWMAKKYGVLSKTWRGDIRDGFRDGFRECFRVLQLGGTLLFKWNETQIKVNDILRLTDHSPLLGHRSGKQMNTHFIYFVK
jgi:hypothetical protein